MSTNVEHPTSTPLTRLIRDNIEDLFDKDGLKASIPESLLSEFTDIFTERSDPDSGEFVNMALSVNCDWGDFTLLLLQFVKAQPEHSLSLFVRDALLRKTQDSLSHLEDQIEMVWGKEEYSGSEGDCYSGSYENIRGGEET